MNTQSIAHIRLANQQLDNNIRLGTPKEVVAWMGAMQSQDYNMAKWAIGIRIPGITNSMVEDALTRGEIIRTHILRPTWHFVTAEDIRWMLELTAPRIRMALKSYNKTTGVDEQIVERAYPIITDVLRNGNHLTRQQLSDIMREKGIETNTHQIGHIMSYAEIDGLVCGGGLVKGGEQTYRLLDEIVPRIDGLDKEEALGKLARLFFNSHAPATLADFTWWSGLNLTEARKGLEMIKEDFVIKNIDGIDYVFNPSFNETTAEEGLVHLLPAFDEYVVSYKDRKDIFKHGHYSKVINTFGIFKPTVMYDGHMIGKWKRAVKSKKVTAEVELFVKVNKGVQKAIDKEIDRFEQYNDIK